MDTIFMNFKISMVKKGFYLELLRSETMKLHRRTRNKITKNGNGENVPHFEIT